MGWDVITEERGWKNVDRLISPGGCPSSHVLWSTYFSILLGQPHAKNNHYLTSFHWLLASIHMQSCASPSTTHHSPRISESELSSYHTPLIPNAISSSSQESRSFQATMPHLRVAKKDRKIIINQKERLCDVPGWW